MDEPFTRSRFVSMDELKEEIPFESLPMYVHGGYNMKDELSLQAWSRSRLEDFPALVQAQYLDAREADNVFEDCNEHTVILNGPILSSFLKTMLYIITTISFILLWIGVYVQLSYLINGGDANDIQKTYYTFSHDREMYDKYMITTPVLLNQTKSSGAYGERRTCVSEICLSNHSPESVQFRSIDIITISSVLNNNLSRMGGTGHWYHLLQKILPSLWKAYQNVWGRDAINSHPLIKELYIVFEEESSVKELGPFGRFVLASILTGGRFEKVHYAHYFEHGIHSHFTADMSQSPSDLFIVSASKETTIPSNDFNILLHVDLVAPRTKFHWFTDRNNLTEFRDSYSRICNITEESASPRGMRYITRKSEIPLDDTLDVLRSGRINEDPSFRHIFTHNGTISIPSTDTNVKLKNIVIYQRNLDRFIKNADGLKKKLEDRTGWNVEILSHSVSTPPCQLIKKLSTTTALISGLLIVTFFTPLHSTPLSFVLSRLSPLHFNDCSLLQNSFIVSII